jgi:hypothetical protein
MFVSVIIGAPNADVADPPGPLPYQAGFLRADVAHRGALPVPEVANLETVRGRIGRLDPLDGQQFNLRPRRLQLFSEHVPAADRALLSRWV